MSREERSIRGGGKLRVFVSIIVCAALVGIAAAVTHWIYSTEPTAQSETATRTTAALVETIPAKRDDYHPRLKVLGTVEPARDVVLSPRVSGQIIHVEPAFVPGGLVDTGQKLVQIDPTDFERILTRRRSELKQVKATLAIEQGRQDVARLEFELLGEEIDPANRSLVLREPQIETIRAEIEAAEAAVEQAELDLERTSVGAPFHAQILSRSANVGSLVAPGDELARLVGVDEYWITASVPLRDLRWVVFERERRPASHVEIRHTNAWEPGAIREGRVSRQIGTVDQESRLARVLVTVRDPLALQIEGPPLVIGTIVELRIEGRELSDVVRLNRDYLRQGDTVWIMNEGVLDIRAVEVVFRDSDYAYIRSGIETGEEVVTTNLATVTDGLPLKKRGDASPSGDDPNSGTP